MRWYVYVNDQDTWYKVYGEKIDAAIKELKKHSNITSRRFVWYRSPLDARSDNIPDKVSGVFGIPTPEDELDDLLEKIYKERTKT